MEKNESDMEKKQSDMEKKQSDMEKKQSDVLSTETNIVQEQPTSTEPDTSLPITVSPYAEPTDLVNTIQNLENWTKKEVYYQPLQMWQRDADELSPDKLPKLYRKVHKKNATDPVSIVWDSLAGYTLVTLPESWAQTHVTAWLAKHPDYRLCPDTQLYDRRYPHHFSADKDELRPEALVINHFWLSQPWPLREVPGKWRCIAPLLDRTLMREQLPRMLALKPEHLACADVVCSFLLAVLAQMSAVGDLVPFVWGFDFEYRCIGYTMVNQKRFDRNEAGETHVRLNLRAFSLYSYVRQRVLWQQLYESSSDGFDRLRADPKNVDCWMRIWNACNTHTL